MVDKKVELQQKRSVFILILAIFLIIIGVAGIILPILPGWPFIFLGIFMIGGLPLLDKLILRHIPKKLRDRIFDPERFKEKN